MEILFVALVALAGGALPLLIRWTDRHLHTALALSTGIFLGAVFLHVLPALSEMQLAADTAPVHAEGAPAGVDLSQQHGGDPWLWLCVLAGVLAVYLIESLVLRTHDHDDLHRHRAVSLASLVGLGVHALTAGIGYAAAQSYTQVGGALLVAILAHKGFEAFSLTTVFQLAGTGRKSILLMVAGFAALTPLGMLLGASISAQMGQLGLGILTALAAGTFLFVCLCELLPEVFHHNEDSWLRVSLLVLGIALTMVFEELGH
jgi:zinc transporter 1/2/3